VYQATQAAEAAQAAAADAPVVEEEPTTAGRDNVVDADFEIVEEEAKK
jgi:hypothetical protein